MIGYVVDDIFLGHRASGAHPERPERASAVVAALEESGALAGGERIAARAATREELGRVHTAAYLDSLERTVAGRSGYLDADTYFCPRSWEAALAAAGASVDLTRAAIDGVARRGFGAIRPPGHHAEPDRAMGFCLLNNAAVAASAALAAGLERVVIVDWDVHHGNGTQTAFWRDPRVLYVSLHQWPFYPGTGASDELGEGEGRGSTLNVPLPAGSGDDEYAAAFDEVVMPSIAAFRPELILVSGGFDAYDGDPLAQMRVSAQGYGRMARLLRNAADDTAGGRVVGFLEGGYSLDGLRACVSAVAEVLTRDDVAREELVNGRRIMPAARAAIERTRQAHLELR